MRSKWLVRGNPLSDRREVISRELMDVFFDEENLMNPQPNDHQSRARQPWLVLSMLAFVLLCSGFVFYEANAQGETEVAGANGTIPPGGTVPPPPTDLDNGFVRVVHVAPFAVDIIDTALVVCADLNTPVAGLPTLYYLSSSDYIPLPPREYDWFAGPPGCGGELVDIPEFRLFGDAALTLYISGGANDQPLTTVLSVDRAGMSNVYYLPFIFQSVIPPEPDPRS